MTRPETSPQIFLTLGVLLAVLGAVRLLVTEDLLRRVLALNVASAGVLLVLVALAASDDPPDPVPHALVLTGIVVTVAVTALAVGLLRRVESGSSPRQGDEPADQPAADGSAGGRSAEGRS